MRVNTWLERRHTRVLDNAYEAAKAIRALEDQYCQGRPVTADAQIGKTVYEYVRSLCDRNLLTIRNNLTQFKINSFLLGAKPAIALVVQFGLTLIAYGSGAPGGLFAPVLIMGASLGSLMGSAAHLLFHVSAPVTYALAGMGILFSAVIRVPITGIVIIFEMTADFNLVLPLMVGSITAYLVGEALSPGSLYDRLLDWRGIHLQEDAPSKWFLAGLSAGNVMSSPVEVINSDMTLTSAIKAFSHSSHQGFPVVQNSKVIGMINQRDLSDLAFRLQSAEQRSEEISGESQIGDFIDAPPITASPDLSLLKVLSLLDRHQLSRLPVVEADRLMGIITRSDIIRIEVERLAQKGLLS